MNNIQFDFEIEQPVAYWCQALSFDAKEFFTALGKTVVNVAMQDGKGAMENALDMLKSAGLEGKTAPILAWSLINTALHKSIYNLVTENEALFTAEQLSEAHIAELSEILSRTMSDKPVGISADFLSNPKNLSLLKEIEVPLTDWLQGLGLLEAEARSIYSRLRDVFPVSLHAEWLSDQATYGLIHDSVTSPFLQATKVEREWKMYNSWLQEQANKAVFSEAFGLRQVFVPLRGYYERKLDSTDVGQASSRKQSLNVERHVVRVEEEIKHWVKYFQADDAIKVISGGPGSGKSSVAKILAADISREFPDVSVLFVPLHHFDIGDDLVSAIDDFIKGDLYLSGNPVDVKHGRNRLLIIFDGLDELSMRGKAASEAALLFVDEVITKIDRFNGKGLKRQALITGRDVAVQSSKSKLRNYKQVLKLLPYYVSEHERNSYNDPEDLLTVDQRDLWWRMYGEAKGKNYTKIPQEVGSRALEPITKEPLLNYLVSLSYERGIIDFNESVTLNEIYSDLLQAVHGRKWDRGNHVGTFDLEQHHFERVLEEIALAIWHGHGRTATISSIQQACENANLSRQLELFKVGVKKGVTRLLTAFYFRECDSNSGSEDSFEFTHKSFGEYLIARRIARQFKHIHTNLRLHYEDFDYPYDEKIALDYWLKVCGPSVIDEYIYAFLIHEVPKSEKECLAWGDTAAKLIPYAIKGKWPVDSLEGLDVETKLKYRSNADLAILAMHHAALKNSKHVTELSSKEENEVGIWLNTVLPRPNARKSFGMLPQIISNLSIANESLVTAQFILLHLSNNCFVDCAFSFVSFIHSSLTECEFVNVDMSSSVLNSPRFSRCKFENSDISSAYITGGHFIGVDAQNVNLMHSTLNVCRFSDCKLSKLVLNHSTILCSTFEGGSMREASYRHTTLKEVKFMELDLSGSSFSGAVLIDVEFSNVDLSGVDFTGSDYEEQIIENQYINRGVDSARLINVKFAQVKIDRNTKFASEQLSLLPDELKEEYLSYR